MLLSVYSAHFQFSRPSMFPISSRGVITISFLLLISGCSAILPSSIKETDRDLSGQFDGKWSIETNAVLGNCKHNFSRTYMHTKNGVIETNRRDSTGYVSKTGNFRIEDRVFDNSHWATRVYSGNLVDGTGRVIVDYRWFHARDCSQSIYIHKLL